MGALVRGAHELTKRMKSTLAVMGLGYIHIETEGGLATGTASMSFRNWNGNIGKTLRPRETLPEKQHQCHFVIGIGALGPHRGRERRNSIMSFRNWNENIGNIRFDLEAGLSLLDIVRLVTSLLL